MPFFSKVANPRASLRWYVMGRYLLQDVSEESYRTFAWRLSKTSQNEPFDLIISSGGGDTDAMWAFHDTILCSKKKITGVAVGICHSAAPLILAACDIRICTPNTQFMVHEDICKIKGSPSKAVHEIARHQNAEDRWYTAMTLLTKTTLHEWRVLSESETYFDSHRALELGVIDTILSVRRGNK